MSPNNVPNQPKLDLKYVKTIPRINKIIPTIISVLPMFILKFTNNRQYTMIPFIEFKNTNNLNEEQIK